MQALRVVSICVVALVGCGDGRQPPDIDVNEDNICRQVAEVTCHNLYSCCSEGEIEDFLGVDEPRSESHCRDDVEKLCTRNIARIADSIANGRAHFDGGVMTNCLEALITPSDCAIVGTELPWAEACEESAFTGAVADGGECFESFECSTDSFCTAQRQCRARAAMGQACSAILPCAEDLACVNSDGTGTKCQARLGVGQMCVSTSQCQEELFCDLEASVRTCQPLRDVGEACTGNGSCASGTCLPGTCSSGTQNCFDDSDCLGRCADDQSSCFDAQDCNPIGTCSLTTTTSCTSDLSCPTGETCVFPVACMLQTCDGPVVCAEPRVVVDYCEAVGFIPGVGQQ